VVVLAEDAVPGAWSACPRVVVGDKELERPEEVVETLHRAWLERRAVVILLQLDPADLRAPQVFRGDVHALQPSFEFPLDRLQFLVWTNNYDARGGEPIWWHARKAARQLEARGMTVGGPADVVLADGTPLYVDGGPPDPPALASGVGVAHRWGVEAGRLDPTGSTPSAANLAPDQMAAVAHQAGAARVIAPAGSGKTRVLTERLRHLVGDRHVHPSTISALAYNTKAAQEMKDRCADVLATTGPHIRTLNSIGLWICTEFSSGGRPRVLSESDVRELLQRQFDIRRQANTDTVAPYISALSAIRLGLSSPEAVERSNPDAIGVADGFDRYRAALAEMGAVDFDEQIYRAIEIVLSDPEARFAAQSRCRRLLVDEFQDLTPAHLLLIRLLAAPGFDCFGVGDDDQVIYGYSGATPEFLIDFDRYFPGAVHHPLEVNYRCPPAVIEAARHLLSYNHRRLDKSIRPPAGRMDAEPSTSGPLAGSGPVAVRKAAGDSLAGLAIDIISDWRERGVGLEDMAVLARVNSTLLSAQVACSEAGVACTAPLDAQVLGRTGMRTAFAYLRIGADPDHIRRDDIRDTVRRPSRGIAPMVVDMITKHHTTSIADIRRLAGRLSGRDVPKVQAYADDLAAVAKATAVSTAAALRVVRVGIGLDATMDVLDSSRKEADRSTHADDLLALESVASLHPDAATFERWLRGVLARAPQDGPSVTLSTVHRIKGKEWGHVIVFGATEGLFPHRLSDDDEGERRVFHVALTRAAVQVVVLADADSPSMFVAELDGSGSRTARSASSSARAAASSSGSSSNGGTKRSGSSRGERRRSSLPSVDAVIGLVLEQRGNVGEVVEVTPSGAVCLVGRAQVVVPFGSDVRVEGRTVTLVAPAGLGQSPDSEAAEAALRAWRLEVAREGGFPAYRVLTDKELVGIANRLPATLEELAACKGMGPLRLERWGDEILALVDAG
jgi:DNA helicase-2/ATP-dependent DNA helicase PcrA